MYPGNVAPGTVAEWTIAAALKAADLYRSGGSNPSRSAEAQGVYQGQHELLGHQDGTIWHHRSAPRSSEIDPEDFFAAPVGSSQWRAIILGSAPTRVKPHARTGLARQASNTAVADDNPGEGTLRIGIERAKPKLRCVEPGLRTGPRRPARRRSADEVGVTNSAPSLRIYSYQSSETPQVRPPDPRNNVVGCPVRVPHPYGLSSAVGADMGCHLSALMWVIASRGI